jgi:hypothetical protein
MVDVSRPDVSTDRMNKTALVIDIAVPLIHNLSNTGQRNYKLCKFGPGNQKSLEV